MECGRVSPSDVLARVRNIEAEHGRITKLHDTITSDEAADQLERFEALTPDEFQRETPKRFPVFNGMGQSNPGRGAGGDGPTPPPGGHRGPVANPPAYADPDNAPSEDDIRNG